MAEEYFSDRLVEWLASHPLVMAVIGLLALLTSFSGEPQLQAVLCVCSGAVNTLTSLANRFQKSLSNLLLFFVGMWAAVIDLFNIDGNPSFLLPYTSFATGAVAIGTYLVIKIKGRP